MIGRVSIVPRRTGGNEDHQQASCRSFRVGAASYRFSVQLSPREAQFECAHGPATVRPQGGGTLRSVSRKETHASGRPVRPPLRHSGQPPSGHRPRPPSALGARAGSGAQPGRVRRVRVLGPRRRRRPHLPVRVGAGHGRPDELVLPGLPLRRPVRRGPSGPGGAHSGGGAGTDRHPAAAGGYRAAGGVPHHPGLGGGLGPPLGWHVPDLEVAVRRLLGPLPGGALRGGRPGGRRPGRNARPRRLHRLPAPHGRHPPQHRRGRAQPRLRGAAVGDGASADGAAAGPGRGHHRLS